MKAKNNPTMEEIRKARESVGMTQEAAARLIGKATITWMKWEAGENKMDGSFFELFLIKTADMKKVRVPGKSFGTLISRRAQVLATQQREIFKEKINKAIIKNGKCGPKELIEFIENITIDDLNKID